MLVTENHYTPKAAWCPNPEWWHSDDDDSDGCEYEVRSILHGLIRGLQPRVVVETGTAAGATARVIDHALFMNGHGHLWTIENDPVKAARATEVFADTMRVTVVAGDSLAWTPPAVPVDFAWIDSGPADVRMQEIANWADLFSKGAVIAVHDTAPVGARLPMYDGMRELFAHLEWPVLDLHTPRGVMIAQKP